LLVQNPPSRFIFLTVIPAQAGIQRTLYRVFAKRMPGHRDDATHSLLDFGLRRNDGGAVAERIWEEMASDGNSH
jgi:hypothetical protein